ncbi:MAG: aminopeptidase P family protein [Butyricicoccus sp.]|nr:aminopeptidase P family protein [Butyricicoccus sp.]
MFDFHARVPRQELEARLAALRARLTAADPGWQLALVNSKVNMYYLAGTMQDGVLTITPNEAILWVRRQYDRAVRESEFADIRPMRSYRTLGEHFGEAPAAAYVEAKTATLEWLGMVRKYLPFGEWKPLVPHLNALRAHKSAYEVDCMREAGKLHEEVVERVMPTLLREGMSEAELCGAVYLELLKRGSMGICRYNQPVGEDVGGFCGFGENTCDALAFDGPDGCAGTCIAVQSIGSPARKLKKGDLVLMDMPAGLLGYHTDKSVVYYYGSLADDPNAALIREAYDLCASIERWAAAELKPGAIPEEIYQQAAAMVPDKFRKGFMGGGKFLGHSIGLTMDEAPVLAKSFREPLETGMLFAVEPKIMLDGIGLVGTENTYLVTEAGGESLTGHVLPLTEIG